MVAYSFKRRFVDPIRVGLGIDNFLLHVGVVAAPKRQTIRADRKRHARPGEELQLYCAQRTKHCFLIGRARCVAVERITLWHHDVGMAVYVGGKILGPRQTQAFARADGFADAADMARFWKEEHGSPAKWEGILIRWEPL